MRIHRLNPPALVMAATALLLLGGGVRVQASEVDGRIVAAARSSYNFKVYLKDDAIKVECANGQVRLTGTVAEEFHRALAEQTVSGLPDVTGVDNRITVNGPQPDPRSDDWITLKVRATLALHRNVSATGTQVNTVKGVVTLTGMADSKAEKDLAGEYAKDVEGVTEVRNELTLAKDARHTLETLGETIDDTSITAQIKTTFLFHKSVRSLATKVITNEGNVSLHGEALSEAERTLVTRLAEDTRGVKHVTNNMTVAKP